MDQQKAAPLAAAQQPGVRPVPREQALASLRSVTPDFYAPTQQPDVPVTDGAALGPGRGPDAIAPAQSGGQLQQILRQMAQFDPTGEVQRLLQSAIAQGL
ncbi:MAG: hypothetical protein IRZ06_10175 [Nevskia sp.]|nr:hypothetical protein [Nevskia sp.]